MKSKLPNEVNLLEFIELVKSGVRPFKDEKKYIDTGSLKTGKIFDSVSVTFETKPSRANMEVEENDVMFAKMKDTEKVYLITKEDQNNLYSTGFAVLRIKDKTRVYPKYLYFWIRTEEFQNRKNQECTGATQKAIRESKLDDFSIALPSLQEQKRIGSILEKANKLREMRNESDELTKKYLNSVFIEMFIDNKKFPVHEFSNLVEKFRFGSSVKSGSDGYPILGIPNVLGDSLELDKCNKVSLTQKEFENFKVKFGDILFVRTNGNPNYVGRCNVFPLENSNHIFASYLIRARIKTNLLDPYFLKTFLESDIGRKELLSKCRTTAGQYNINTQGLGSIKIPLPPLNQQEKFSSIVHKITDLKEYQKLSKEQISNIFNKLTQLAFRGELVC